MRSFIAAIALQQLREMEELQRDLGRRKRDQTRERATRRSRWAVLRQGRRR